MFDNFLFSLHEHFFHEAVFLTFYKNSGLVWLLDVMMFVGLWNITHTQTAGP